VFFFNIELKGEEGWTKLNYVAEFDTSLESVHDNVPRQDCNKISKSEFVEKFEKPRIPVVLTHAMDHWKAMRKWTTEVSFSNTYTWQSTSNLPSSVEILYT